MKNLFFLLILLFIAPAVASAQGSYFNAQVSSQDPCCIAINAGLQGSSDPSDTWSVVVDGTTTYDENSPLHNNLEIRHCLAGNGTHVVNFYVNGVLTRTRTVVITGCDPCEVCNISDMLLWPNIQDTCGLTVSLLVTFPSINGVQGPSSLCTNPNYTWSYGDGSPAVSTGIVDYTSYSYANPGTYEVCVTYSTINPAGDTCHITKCDSIVVTGCGQDPCCGMKIDSLKLSISPFDPCRIFIVSDLDMGSCGAALSWSVNGNVIPGQTSPNLLTLLAGTGPHQVCLIMSSPTDSNCTITECITVTGCDPCEVCNISDMLLWPNIQDTCALTVSLLVTFPSINGVQGPSSLCTNPNYTWSYGDGSPAVSTGIVDYTSYSYANPGTYEVCVTYSTINPDGDTCRITKCDSIVVTGCDQEPCCGMKIDGLKLFTSSFDPCRIFVISDLDMGSCGSTLSWSVNGNVIPGQTGSNLFTNLAGTGPHQVCLIMSSPTDPNCTITECITVTGCNDGLTNGGNKKMRTANNNNAITDQEWEAATEFTLELFPNPATNELNIKLPNAVTSTIESIQIINVNGQVVKTEHAISTSLLSIDISTLASGVYMVRTISKDGMTQTTKQFVKNK